MTQSVIEGAEDAWTSPDLVASSELPSMNKAPTRPLYPTDSSSRIKDQHHRANYTWRATYE